jgi:hypothetical protein
MNAQEQPPDLRVVKGQKALQRLDAQTANTLSDWAEYGAALEVPREQAGTNDKLFGKLVKELGLDARPAQDSAVRANALWLARNWDHLCALHKDNQCPHSHPDHARQWCRKQGFAWATDPAKAPKAKAAKGVFVQASEVLVAAGEPAITKDEDSRLRNNTTYRKEVFGDDINLMKLTPDAVPAAIEMVVEAIRQSRVSVTLPDTKDGIKATLTKQGDKDKLDRAIKKAEAIVTAELRASFHTELKKAVDARVIEVSGQYDKLIKEAEATIIHYNAMRGDVTTYLTYDEFRLIRSCLHPDREPDEERRRKAFQIFCELEAEINPATPVSTLRERGWSHVRGGRK